MPPLNRSPLLIPPFSSYTQVLRQKPDLLVNVTFFVQLYRVFFLKKPVDAAFAPQQGVLFFLLLFLSFLSQDIKGGPTQSASLVARWPSHLPLLWMPYDICWERFCWISEERTPLSLTPSIFNSKFVLPLPLSTERLAQRPLGGWFVTFGVVPQKTHWIAGLSTNHWGHFLVNDWSLDKGRG